MTQSKFETIKSYLKNLNYPNNEIRVYLALLEIQNSNVGPLIKKTGLHRQIVYNALEKLAEKKLVTAVVKNNRQHYSIADTDVFLENANQYQKSTKNLVSELKQLQGSIKYQQNLVIYEGVEGLHEMHLKNIKNQPRKTTLNFIGAGGLPWFENMRINNVLKKYEKIRLERGIDINLVSFDSKRKEVEQTIKEDINQGPKRGKYYRYIAQDLANPVVTQIWHKKVAMIIYGTPILIIEINNPQVAENFNNYFTALWKIGEK